MNKLKEKKIPIILSVGLHLIIFSLLFIKLPHSRNKTAENVNIVQAVAINEHALATPTEHQASNVPVLPENTIRRIEQTTLKQPEVAKIPVSKPAVQEPEPIKPPIPVRGETQKIEPVALQQPRVEDNAKLVAKQKAAAEKKQAEEEQKKLKQQEVAQLKKRRAEEAAQLQKELAAEAKTPKETAAESDDTDEVASNNDDSEQGEPATTKEEVGSSKTAAVSSTGELDKYKQMIVQTISRKWVIPENLENNIACSLLVHLGPGGVVLSVDVVKESGDENLDRSARNAIMKASPLPVPESLDLFDNFRALRLTFRPEGIVSG